MNGTFNTNILIFNEKEEDLHEIQEMKETNQRTLDLQKASLAKLNSKIKDMKQDHPNSQNDSTFVAKNENLNIKNYEKPPMIQTNSNMSSKNNNNPYGLNQDRFKKVNHKLYLLLNLHYNVFFLKDLF